MYHLPTTFQFPYRTLCLKNYNEPNEIIVTVLSRFEVIIFTMRQNVGHINCKQILKLFKEPSQQILNLIKAEKSASSVKQNIESTLFEIRIVSKQEKTFQIFIFNRVKTNGKNIEVRLQSV